MFIPAEIYSVVMFVHMLISKVLCMITYNIKFYIHEVSCMILYGDKDSLEPYIAMVSWARLSCGVSVSCETITITEYMLVPASCMTLTYNNGHHTQEEGLVSYPCKGRFL